MSNLIPRDFINTVLERTDIVELIQSYVPLRKRGSNFIACCPFHNEKTPSFTVSHSKQFYHCFGCGVGGNAITFLMEYERLNFVETVEMLAKQHGLDVPRDQGTQQRSQHDNREPLYKILEQTKQFYQAELFKPENKKRLDYLIQRGLNKEIIQQYELGFAPSGWNNLQKAFGNNKMLEPSLITSGLLIKKAEGNTYDRFRERIMYPILNRQGRVIGFGGRSLGDENPKYLNSPETPIFYKGQELYGISQAHKHLHEQKRAIVVEGYMDVLVLAQHNVKNVVATAGTAATTKHLIQLFRYVPELIFCFDGDNAGRNAAWRALENVFPLLQDGFHVRFILLPEGEDPDSIMRKEGVEQFNLRIKEAVNLSDFFYKTLSAQVDLSSLDGKACLKQKAIPVLKTLPDGVFKQLMQKRLSELLRIDDEKITRIMEEDNTAHPKYSLSPNQNQRVPSPIRLAITLLIQNPALISHVDDIQSLDELKQPGVELLIKLLELLKQRPNISTGVIIEYFRDHPQYGGIKKLAACELHIPEAGLGEEIISIFKKLQQLNHEQRIEKLLYRAAQQGLSEAERQTLHQLIADKHYPKSIETQDDRD